MLTPKIETLIFILLY